MILLYTFFAANLQMPSTLVWIPAVFLGFLMLHNAAAQSQMCEEHFQAVLTLVTNKTYPASAQFLDSDLVYFREVLRYTEAEIDRETEAAMQFFRDSYGLDFTNVEPDEKGRRSLGNATMRPFMTPYNNTFVDNRWLANGNTRSKCYQVGDGGFQVRFSGPVMLYGEYGGTQGRRAFANEGLLYGYDYIYDACDQQGIEIQVSTIAPARFVRTDGFLVTTFRVRNRRLGEGLSWGASRVSSVNPTTNRFEGRQVFTFV